MYIRLDRRIILVVGLLLAVVAVTGLVATRRIVANRVTRELDAFTPSLVVEDVRTHGGVLRPWRVTIGRVDVAADSVPGFSALYVEGVDVSLRRGALTTLLRRGSRALPSVVTTLSADSIGADLRRGARGLSAILDGVSIDPPDSDGAWVTTIDSTDLVIWETGAAEAAAASLSDGANGDVDRTDLPYLYDRSLSDMLAPILDSLLSAAHVAPPARLSLRSGEIAAPAGTVPFSATVRTDGTAPVVGTIAVTDARLETGPIAATLGGEIAVMVHSSERLSTAGEITWNDVVLTDERIAAAPIVIADGRYEFEAGLDADAAFPTAELARRIPGTEVPPPIGAGAPEDQNLAGALTVTRGRLELGEVTADLRPKLVGLNAPQAGFRVAAPARIDLELSLPRTPLNRIAEIVPPAIAGPLAELELGGAVQWDFRMEAPLRQFSWTRWEETNELSDFSILAIPAAWDVRLLAGGFVHEIVDEETRFERVIRVPGSVVEAEPPSLGAVLPDVTPDPSYRYVPLNQIAPELVGAVITVEDGEYWRHQGVNWMAINTAVELMLREGEIVIGGSTIPMQLAKNIFLDNRRVVSRKVQEIALVALANLSGVVTRERVVELYLNVIEFAPSVWGIADATQFYFGVDPDELSVEQSVWLATIISSPRRFWVHKHRGGLSDAWLAWMEQVMEIMVERGRLSEEQLEAARGRQVVFAP